MPKSNLYREPLSYYQETYLTRRLTIYEGLLYSPSKKPFLEQSQSSRTPIKLVNYTNTEDGQKIVVNDMTYVGTPQATEY